MVVEGWLARAAAARPAHPALITPAGSWSYAQLLAAADAGAQELAHAGVQAGARVAIALPGGLAFAQALHACMLLGAVAVPVDTRLTPRERAQVSAGSTQVIAEPLPPAPARSGGVPACLTYGLTEACSQVSTTPLAALASEEDGPGPPLFCTRVRIGAAPGEQAGGGEEGEITIAGPTVAPTAAAPDGWLRSGDLGRLDERGRLHVTGRASELIVSGGENVAPEEVEAVLESHADVLEA